jgi:hypothetical protein
MWNIKYNQFKDTYKSLVHEKSLISKDLNIKNN